MSSSRCAGRLTGQAIGLAVVLACGCCAAWSQAITFTPVAPIDRRYTQIQTTNVSLPKEPIDARGHQDILRSLSSEQGFAMRPLPRGKKGLSLVANGKLTPSGEGYVSMVSEHGLSVKPGDRVVLSNIRIDRDRIIFDINGGPEHKHEFLRHFQIGMSGPQMASPVVQDQPEDDKEPTGARITLAFEHQVPDVTPSQIKALLAPLISFDVKTPVQAYTDTLPPTLKKAILEHKILVGMSTDMVLFTLGQPEKKSRETEGDMPFEEWIYGQPPQDVSFVRINGNRVIRVEIAKLGQPLEIFTKDVVSDLMTTDGRSVLAENVHEIHTTELGDVQRNPDTQSPKAPPTLRKPGEKLPDDDPNSPTLGGNREGPMKPVIFPKDTTNDPAHTTSAAPPAAKPAPSSSSSSASSPASPGSASPDSGTAKPDAPNLNTPAPETPTQPPQPSSDKPPAGSSYFQGPVPARM